MYKLFRRAPHKKEFSTTYTSRTRFASHHTNTQLYVFDLVCAAVAALNSIWNKCFSRSFIVSKLLHLSCALIYLLLDAGRSSSSHHHHHHYYWVSSSKNLCTTVCRGFVPFQPPQLGFLMAQYVFCLFSRGAKLTNSQFLEVFSLELNLKSPKRGGAF